MKEMAINNNFDKTEVLYIIFWDCTREVITFYVLVIFSNPDFQSLAEHCEFFTSLVHTNRYKIVQLWACNGYSFKFILGTMIEVHFNSCVVCRSNKLHFVYCFYNFHVEFYV